MFVLTGTLAAVDWLTGALPVFCLILLIVSGFVVFILRNRRHNAEFKALAARLGLKYHSEASGVMRLHPRLDLFGFGTICRVRNHMRGTVGEIMVRLFDYQYTYSSGNHGEREPWRTISAVLIELPGKHRKVRADPCDPRCVRNPADEKWRVDVFDDDFDARYEVTARNVEFARTVFNSDSIGHVKKYADMHVEVADSAALFHRDRKLPTDEIADLLKTAIEFLKCVPEFEFAKHGEPSMR